MFVRVDPDHPLAPGLASLWLPSQFVGADFLPNLAPLGNGGGAFEPMPFPSAASQRPAWDTGRMGACLRFSGGQVLTRSLTPLGARGPWRPTVSANFTLAIYGELVSPGGEFDTLYSISRSTGGSAEPQATIFRQNVAGTLVGEFTLDGVAWITLPIASPDVGVPFIAVLNSNGAANHRFTVLTPGAGAISTTANTSIDRGLASADPDQEQIGAQTYGGAVNDHANFRLYGAWFWNRGLTFREVVGFLLDPFGMLDRGRVSAGGSVGGVQHGETQSARVTATASLIAGAPEAGATVNGAALAATATLIPGTPIGSGDAIAGNVLLGATATLVPGDARAASGFFGTTLEVVSSLTAGSRLLDNTAPGRTLTAVAMVVEGPDGGGEGIPRPTTPIGGGGFGPGGVGAGMDPERRRRIRRSLQRALGDGPTPEDVADMDLDEIEALLRELGRPEPPRDDPEAMVAMAMAAMAEFEAEAEAEAALALAS